MVQALVVQVQTRAPCPANEACILNDRQRGVYATQRTLRSAAECEACRSVRPLIFYHPPRLRCHSKPSTQSARLSLKFMQTNTAECEMSECSAVASDNQVVTGDVTRPVNA